MRVQKRSDRRVQCALVCAIAYVITISPSLAATYTFVPSASTTPVPGATANWNLAANWVNASGNTTTAIPGATDTAGSSTGATTIVDTLVPTINDLRWANAASGTSVATLMGSSVVATGDATLRISAGGALTVRATSGSASTGASFGRAVPSGGHLILDGGMLTTDSAVAITNDLPANLVIGDTSTFAAAASSTFVISSGTANVGNNFIVGNTFAAPNMRATGTVTQTGGVINVAGAVFLGANGTSNYTMSGGTLNEQGINNDGGAFGRDAFFVGRNTNAVSTFTQSGAAAVHIANGLCIANASDSIGTYTASGGTLSINGELRVGASTNSNNVTLVSNNVGAFKIVGRSMPTITANRLIANTFNSTLGFAIDSDAGPTLLNIVAAGILDGRAVLSTAAKLDIDNGAFAPNPQTVFELIRATSFNALPQLVTDGDAFDGYKVGLLDSGTSQSLVVAPFAVSTWTGAGSDEWSGTGNWMGSVPATSRDVATFSAFASPAAHQIHLPADVSVGIIHFVDATNGYSIAGTAELTLDSGTASTAAVIDVNGGSHVLALPIALNSDLTILSSAGKVQFTESLAAHGKAVTKSGVGDAEFKSLKGVGNLNVAGGKLTITAAATSNSAIGASKINSLSIDPVAQLDLKNNALVIDYSGAIGTQLGQLRDHLKAGRLLGSTDDGLVLGYNDNGTRSVALTNVAGLDIDATSLIVFRTIAGDANLDRAVNFDDLIALAQGYNSANRVWAQGDFNYDGVVNFDDLIILAQHYNTNAPIGLQVANVLGESFAVNFALAQSLVPEPMGLFAMGAAAFLLCPRRGSNSR